MGAQQVGKAAISGWRDVFGPALGNGMDVAIWPFAGPLDALLARGGLVVAESYPAEFYGHLAILFPRAAGGKRRQNARAANAKSLLTWAAANPVVLGEALEAALRNGFGAAADGEDRFDAVVGLFGMLNILFSHRQAGEPDDRAARRGGEWRGRGRSGGAIRPYAPLPGHQAGAAVACCPVGRGKTGGAE